MASAQWWSVSAVDGIEQELKKINPSFDWGGDDETTILHWKRIALFVALLDELKKEGLMARQESALDVGCLAGIYSKLLSDHGFREVVGLDISPKYVSLASSIYTSEVRAGRMKFMTVDAQDMDTSHQYDLILCTEVIEHVKDPRLVISNIYKALRSDGIAIVSLPNLVSIPQLGMLAMAKIRGSIDPELELHMKYPFFKTAAMFKEAGFEVIRTSGSNLTINAQLIGLMNKCNLLRAINKLDSIMSSKRPFNYFSQSFFMVLKKSTGNRK
jgi:2-polyprenyl-3-methyl-5-hydroxy-6-metoxy-1,4-benzoquinol methylase